MYRLNRQVVPFRKNAREVSCNQLEICEIIQNKHVFGWAELLNQDQDQRSITGLDIILKKSKLRVALAEHDLRCWFKL